MRDFDVELRARATNAVHLFDHADHVVEVLEHVLGDHDVERIVGEGVGEAIQIVNQIRAGTRVHVDARGVGDDLLLSAAELEHLRRGRNSGGLCGIENGHGQPVETALGAPARPPEPSATSERMLCRSPSLRAGSHTDQTRFCAFSPSFARRSPFSTSSRSADANAGASKAGTRTPDDSSMSSGAPPSRVVTIGRPAANASMKTRLKPSPLTFAWQ